MRNLGCGFRINIRVCVTILWLVSASSPLAAPVTFYFSGVLTGTPFIFPYQGSQWLSGWYMFDSDALGVGQGTAHAIGYEDPLLDLSISVAGVEVADSVSGAFGIPDSSLTISDYDYLVRSFVGKKVVDGVWVNSMSIDLLSYSPLTLSADGSIPTDLPPIDHWDRKRQLELVLGSSANETNFSRVFVELTHLGPTPVPLPPGYLLLMSALPISLLMRRSPRGEQGNPT